MIKDSCPIPIKKQRTQSNAENSDSDELNLSKTFDEDYQLLMNEEILKICKQPNYFNDNLEISQLFSNFQNRCSELLQWIESACNKPKQKIQCRCDVHLDNYDKMCCIKSHSESPRYTSIKILSNFIISSQPDLASQVQCKIDELQKLLNSKYHNLDIDLSVVVKDIKADINDLRIWLDGTDKKLNAQIDKQRMDQNESVENILNDFKVHDDINNSIARTINKVIQMDSSETYNEELTGYKTKLDGIISLIHFHWLKAMELKCKLDNLSNVDGNPGVTTLGPESGFESEISPMNPTRGLPISNLYVMKYISSSGECMWDNNTTDFPMDSESYDFSGNINHHSNNDSSSSSLIETMPELTRHCCIVKDDLHVRRKQKRLRKRRQHVSKSTDFFWESISNQESEKYLRIRNAFFKQSYSLKRRISETSIVQELEKPDETACRISDLAAAAEKIVMRNDLNHRNDYFSESPKESELDDEYNIIISSGNDLNVKEVWDNYQASLYSNDDGDSQILDLDKIRDWEQGFDSNDQEIEHYYDEKTFQIVTSGYETSMESSDTHFCNRNLISVLKFSANQQLDVKRRIDAISNQLGKPSSSPVDKINSIISDQISISNTHIKLLDQILNNDPCVINQNEVLVEQIRLLQDEWDNTVRISLITLTRYREIDDCKEISQIIEKIEKIDSNLSAINTCNDVISLKSTIDLLKENEFQLIKINTRIAEIRADGNYLFDGEVQPIWGQVQAVKERNLRELRSRQSDLQIIQLCMKRIGECQKTRSLVEAEIKGLSVGSGNGDVSWHKKISDDALDAVENNRLKVQTCLKELSSLSSSDCSAGIRLILENEMEILDLLDTQLALFVPVVVIDDKIGSRTATRTTTATSSRQPGFLNRIPVRLALVVIIAMCGYWYKNQVAANSCQMPSDWFRLIRKYTNNNMEPH